MGRDMCGGAGGSVGLVAKGGLGSNGGLADEVVAAPTGLSNAGLIAPYYDVGLE